MAIATIAATATYKWLSSVGFSSADRMAIAEAKEASHAGLDATRSWMTYHANEVGAIVRQYFDGGKKPVALTNVVHSMTSSKQVFSVWLTSVDASSDPYKFTVVSTGSSRGDTKYSETSVLNVRGLYKAKIPVEQEHINVDFGYTYFGGSTHGTQGIKNTSVIINGNWNGNPPKCDEDFIVTGDAELSGNDLDFGAHTCIGGDFVAENGGISGKDLYVHGNALNFKGTLSGSVYFNGNVEINQSDPAMTATGDVTVNGKYNPGQSAGNTLSGNLCMGKNAKIEINKNMKPFKAEKNVTIRSSNPISIYDNPFMGVIYDYKNLLLGGSGYKVSIVNTDKCNMIVPQCYGATDAFYIIGDSHLFKSKATKVTSISDDMKCDTSVVDYCLSVLGSKKTGEGCDGSDYKIQDKIASAYDNFKNMNTTDCGNLVVNPDKTFDVETLNNCYITAPRKQLYNGYLVVKLNEEKRDHKTILTSTTGELDGNFIFYAEDSLKKAIKLPTTTANSNVFIYLNGAYDINTTKAEGKRNYFVYSTKGIEWLHHDVSNESKRIWNGSFYLTAESCAGIHDMNTGHQKLEFNSGLMQHLLDHYVICGIPEGGDGSDCGTPTINTDKDSTGANEGAEDNVEGYDEQYVATAPQLSISLESQSRNKESMYENLRPSEYTAVHPSVVVLPRIIYLSEKPEGSLQDYFKVVNLNGATESFDASKIDCEPGINETGLLETIAPHVYECEYKTGNADYGNSKFWVDVEGDISEKSLVYFEEAVQRAYVNSSAPLLVKLHADTNQTAPVTAIFKVTGVPTGWNAIKGDGVNVVGTSSLDGSQQYSVTIQPGSSVTAFSVTIDDDGVKDMMSFILEDVSTNGRIGVPSTSTIQLTGDGFIHRASIPADFCNSGAHEKINDVLCTDIVERDDCSEGISSGTVGEWLVADCPERITEIQNNKWLCSFVGTDGIKLKAENVSPLCDLFIYDSTLTDMVDGAEYTLYASYKAKMFSFKVEMEGVDAGSKIKVRFSNVPLDSNNKDNETVWLKDPVMCSAPSCHFQAAAGSYVTFEPIEKGGDNFTGWRINGKDDLIKDVPFQVIAKSDTTIRAVFNERDKHCFYSTFENTGIWCDGSKSDCIDKCIGIDKNGSCTTTNGGNHHNSGWIVPRTNDGQIYTEPQKDGQMFLYYSAGNGNSNSGNSTITYLLNRAEAGSHGKMTASFKTCSKEQNNKNLNSGFVLRSNSSSGEYAIVNILKVTGDGSPKMVARVCEGNGSGIKNANSGGCKEATFPGMSAPSSETVFNMSLDLRADLASITLSYKSNDTWISSTVSVEIPVAASSNPEDQFVGASLADDCFKVGNIGWEAYDWGEDACTDIPEISCSFASNYLGGILPVNQKVTPWVGTSKWFNDPNDAFKIRKGCKLTYHYNGCDLASGYGSGTCVQWQDGSTHCASSCHNANDEGPYYVTGINAEKLNSSSYAFTYSGLHGTSKQYMYEGSTIFGAVRDASIVMDCSGNGGNGQVFTESCGRFTVGKITQCAQNMGFRVSSCAGGNDCTVGVVGGYANLRHSSIVGEIIGLPDVDNSGNAPVVNMVLKDVAGRSSQQIKIYGNGTFSRDVDIYADMQDFDPEQVVSFEFTSGSAFTLKSLQSECPNSIGIYNCVASYDGNSLEINSSIMNSQNATCVVKGVGNEFKSEEKDCPANGVFNIPATKLQQDINSSNEEGRELTFTVTMMSKDNKDLQEICTTEPLTVNSNGLHCELSTGIEKVQPGDAIPPFYYSVSNCPATGCLVDLTLNNGNKAQVNYSAEGQFETWAPAGTLKNGTYTYKVEYQGTMCYRSFDVSTSSVDNILQNCAVDADTKTFSAKLNLPNGSNSILKLVTTDQLGNPVGKVEQVSKTSTDKSYSHKLPPVLAPGQYVFTLSTGVGLDAVSCSVPYEVEDMSGVLPENLGCYIEGGYFKTSVKNNTPNPIQASLNCGAKGKDYGNTVQSITWAKGTYIDVNAFVESWRGQCEEYHLINVGKNLCSVAMPKLAEEAPEGESSSSAEEAESSAAGAPSGNCAFVDGSGSTIYSGPKKGSYMFRVTNIQNVPEGAKLNITAKNVSANATVNNGTASASFSQNGNYSEGFTASYNGQKLCEAWFTWY